MRSLYGAVVCIFLMAFHAEAQAPAAGTPQAMTPAQNYYHGRHLEATNRMAEAIPHYNEVVRVAFDQITRHVATRDTYVLLTRALRRLGRHNEVVNWGQQGLRVFPDEFRLLETMGQSFFFLGNFEQSLAHMERYADVMPEGDRISLAYFFIGEIFRLTQKFYRADMAYTMALHFEPGMALWWYRLGSVREQIGDVGPALEAHRRALAINPNHSGARNAVVRLTGD